MDQYRQFKKEDRRKKITLNNALWGTCAYCIAFSSTLMAKFLGFTSMTYIEMMTFFSIFIVISLLHILVILLRKNISRKQGVVLFISYFSFWFVAFWLWVLLLREARYIAPFVAITALIFLLVESNFIISLLVTAIATIEFLSASYVGIEHLGQPGPLTREIMVTFAYLPTALFISYMAQQFKNQRREVREAKNSVERARDALWGEMELAKKIQTVLLPHEPSIDGYDIVAYMAPAAEVGGDYYDVINVDGMDWLVIGDVSGHGVSAGLVMMMVQTSIHTVLAGDAHKNPEGLLVQVNQVITDNIRRLQDDKYMTITVIACVKDGKFYYSGLHQDIMVYRAATMNVERVETDGIWLGVMDNIDGLIPEKQFTLEIGDVILLYTDGITEAWLQGSIRNQRDPEQAMFGDGRLAEALKQNGMLHPAKIKEGLLNAMAGFTPNDDITLVIMKRVS